MTDNRLCGTRRGIATQQPSANIWLIDIKNKIEIQLTDFKRIKSTALIGFSKDDKYIYYKSRELPNAFLSIYKLCVKTKKSEHLMDLHAMGCTYMRLWSLTLSGLLLSLLRNQGKPSKLGCGHLFCISQRLKEGGGCRTV